MKTYANRAASAILAFLLTVSVSSCAKFQKAASSGTDIANFSLDAESGSSKTASKGSGAAASGTKTGSGANSTPATYTGGTDTDTIGHVNEKKITNLKGRQILLAMENDGSVSYFKDTSQYMYKSLRDTEKKYNCKFKVVAYDAGTLGTNLQKAHLAGNYFCDATTVRGYNLDPNDANSGMYVQLDRYANFTDPVWNRLPYKTSGIAKGHRYLLPWMGPNPAFLIYNKDILRASGVSDPWTYVKSNNWNLNTFYTICKKIKATNSSYAPLHTESDGGFPAKLFLQCNGNMIVTTGSNGQPSFTATGSQAASMLSLAKKWYDEGLVMTDAQIKNLKTNNFDAFETGKVGFFRYHIFYVGFLIQHKYFKADQLGIVYFPKGPNVSSYTSVANDVGGFAVPVEAKDKEDLIPVLRDAFQFWSSDKSSPISVDDVALKAINYDYYVDFLSNSDYKSAYLNAAKSVKFDKTVNYTGALGSTFAEETKKIRDGVMTVQQAMDTYSKKIQASLNSQFKGQ